MKLDGKLALVTGGTDGIGAQLIRQLRGFGTQVITTGLNAERIAATAADGFEVVGADLSTPEGVEALIAALAGRPLDILINNAGMGDGEHDHRKGLPDADRAAQAIALNLTAPIRLITALMPTLRVAAEQRGGAMVVNVTSGLAIAPRGGGPVYCATKAAMLGLTRSWAREFAPRILVNAVAPGPTDTPLLGFESMNEAQKKLETAHPLGRIGRPEEVAAAVLFLAGSGATLFTGQCLGANGGAAMA